jgi:hypothetical protein
VEWTQRLVEGQTLLFQGKEIAETAHAVGVVRGLDHLLLGIKEKLEEQWNEAQAELNAKMLEESI